MFHLNANQNDKVHNNNNNKKVIKFVLRHMHLSLRGMILRDDISRVAQYHQTELVNI